MKATNLSYVSLLKTIRLATDGKLEKLFIVVPETEVGREWNSTPLVQALLQGVSLLNGLGVHPKEVHFTLPSAISFSSGRSSQDSKRFHVVEDDSILLTGGDFVGHLAHAA